MKDELEDVINKWAKDYGYFLTISERKDLMDALKSYEKRKIEAISKYDPKIEKVMMYLIDNKYISTEVYVKLSDVLKELGI